MTPTAPAFDLLTEPWIPVLARGGGERVVSPLQVYEQADDLVGVGGELPTTAFALTRLLLAVLHRAVEGPRDPDHWADLWEAPGLPVAAIGAYLERWAHRFDLFSATEPFLQVAGLSGSRGGWSGLEKLIADVPNGRPLFTTRSGRALHVIPAAEAARWLVHAHAFDTSGIKTGAQGDSRVKGGKGYPDGVAWPGHLGGILVEGPSLRDTLLLNLVPYRGVERLGWGSPADDRPVWERPPLGPDVEPDADGRDRRRPHGPADLYTWPSRRIRLGGDPTGVRGVVLSYGDRLAQQDAHTFEPMTGWRRSEPQEKALKRTPVYMPFAHSVERVFWRGLEAVLADARAVIVGPDASARLAPAVLVWLAHAQYDELLPAETIVRTRATGMVYGAQSAVVDEVVDDQLASRLAVLRAEDGAVGQQVLAAVRRCEDAVRALKNLAGNLVRAAGGDGEVARARAEETAFAALDAPFRSWLAGLDAESQAAEIQAEWQRQVRDHVQRVADELIEASGAGAFVGRFVQGRHVDSGLADAWFRAALDKALPEAPRVRVTVSTTEGDS